MCMTVFVEFKACKYFISLDSASYKNGIVFISFSHIFSKFRSEHYRFPFNSECKLYIYFCRSVYLFVVNKTGIVNE